LLIYGVNYFVTAIDTDSGKTFVSAILCEALDADYWKPVQAGLPKDSDTVKSLATNTPIHPETYLLKVPASPHASAKQSGVEISLDDFSLPKTANTLVIEGAGGCLVPLNDHNFVIDLVKPFKAEIILVADLYLGSINHTLLTIEALMNRKLKIRGIVFNGESNPESERIILLHSGLRCLLRIKKETEITPDVVKKYAQQLSQNWYG
jgi:dethiobiotin synthetase